MKPRLKCNGSTTIIHHVLPKQTKRNTNKNHKFTHPSLNLRCTKFLAPLAGSLAPHPNWSAKSIYTFSDTTQQVDCCQYTHQHLQLREWHKEKGSVLKAVRRGELDTPGRLGDAQATRRHCNPRRAGCAWTPRRCLGDAFKTLEKGAMQGHGI